MVNETNVSRSCKISLLLPLLFSALWHCWHGNRKGIWLVKNPNPMKLYQRFLFHVGNRTQPGTAPEKKGLLNRNRK